MEHAFYGFTGVIHHLGCWENTQKACKSVASFSRVLPTSRVVYHAGKPIESVVYCLTNKLEKLTLKNSAALSILRKFEILIYIQ